MQGEGIQQSSDKKTNINNMLNQDEDSLEELVIEKANSLKA